MRFISKSSNLLVVLRPGLPAQPMTGTPAKSTISVRFRDGIADVSDEELQKMMLNHPGFNSDFISAESVNNIDPYDYLRQDTEPQHVVTELKFGSPVARHIEGGRRKLPPELQKLVQDMATNLAKEMLPGMVESVLKGLVKKENPNADVAVIESETEEGDSESEEDGEEEVAVPVMEEETKPKRKYRKRRAKRGRKPKAAKSTSTAVVAEDSTATSLTVEAGIPTMQADVA